MRQIVLFSYCFCILHVLGLVDYRICTILFFSLSGAAAIQVAGQAQDWLENHFNIKRIGVNVRKSGVAYDELRADDV